MTKNTTNDTYSAAWVYVGLDVHKETIAVAAAKLDKADCLVLGSSPTTTTRLFFHFQLAKVVAPEKWLSSGTLW